MHVPLVCVVLSAVLLQRLRAGSHGRPAHGLQAVLTGHFKSHRGGRQFSSWEVYCWPRGATKLMGEWSWCTRCCTNCNCCKGLSCPGALQLPAWTCKPHKPQLHVVFAFPFANPAAAVAAETVFPSSIAL